MKDFILSKLILLSCACLIVFQGYGQVSTYQHVWQSKKDTYNYSCLQEVTHKQKKNKEVRIVFSDRAENNAFTNAYGQRTLSLQGLGTAYYVLEEKNGYCRLVSADEKMLGRPKGLLGRFYGTGNHFKEADKVQYIGWIPRSKLLFYDHAFVSAENNRPIRYRIGIAGINRLYDLHRHLKGDSLKVYSDPFLKKTTGDKFLMGQIVYAYKYDETRQSVLVSDKPRISSEGASVLGWIPSDMMAAAGQYHLYRFTPDTPRCTAIVDTDTLSLRYLDLQSELVFSWDDKPVGPVEENKSEHWGKVSLPLSVWDHSKNKFINIKGEDIAVSDVKRMALGQKNVNLHVFAFSKEKGELKRLINSFQSIALKMNPARNYTFSATIISDVGNIHLPPTRDLAAWLDFLTNPTASYADKSGVGFGDAFNWLVKEVAPNTFEENQLFILGSNQPLSLSGETSEQLARRLFSITIMQLTSSEGEDSQDFLLKAKEIVDMQITSYTNYITGYVVEPTLVKSSLFLDYGTEANVYLLEAPTNSLATGGIVFPFAGERLSNTTIELVVDTLLSQSERRNTLLLNSLIGYEKKLGVLRSQPSQAITRLHKTSYLHHKLVTSIDRNSVSDTYLLRAEIPDTVLSRQHQAYLFAEDEMRELLQSYRDLLPVFNDSIGKKQLRMLRGLYKRERKQINSRNHRNFLDGKSNIAELFYHKTGIWCNDNLLYEIKPSELRMERCLAVDWEGLYRNYISKIRTIEEGFVRDKLEVITIGGVTYYLIPKEQLP